MSGERVASADHRGQVNEFLTSRRERVTPEQAGLSTFGERRRVKGLRREEVATLAGVSAVYYTRLERGNLVGVSESVLESVARALQLDSAERDHLFDLARTANASASSRTRQRAGASRPRVSPLVQRVLDAITDAPADLRNGRGDILAANRLGRALYAEIHAEVIAPPNSARYTFLNPRAKDFFVDWDDTADVVVANLRTEAGHNPYDRALTDLVGELSTRSEEFRVRWASHDVRRHATGTKRLRHPVAGDLEVDYQTMALTDDPGLRLTVYSARPDSASAAALQFLASWAATAEETTGDSRAHRT